MTDRADRGASVVLNYVLAISIATVLITGLLFAGGSFVDGQRKAVVDNELAVVGQRLAADVERVDRLVVAGDGATTVELERSLPGSAAGRRYDIRLVAGPNPRLVLTAQSSDVSATVPLSNTTPLANASVNSGAVVVRYDQATGRVTLADG